MSEAYWFIKRRDRGDVFEWTGSWWREGAWDLFTRTIFENTPRRSLRKDFHAVKAQITILAPKEEK